MATQTSLVAQQVRIRQWAEQIRNCQNRPKGMDVETWCTQNNLTKAASPQTWVLAMKNPRILRGLRRFYRNDQDH